MKIVTSKSNVTEIDLVRDATDDPWFPFKNFTGSSATKDELVAMVLRRIVAGEVITYEWDMTIKASCGDYNYSHRNNFFAEHEIDLSPLEKIFIENKWTPFWVKEQGE